jgi:tRNA(Leu) C34 or U34 (ribose-2'-O)-methylase TrmL
VHGVIFPTHRQAPLSPAAVKASAGAVEHLLLVPVDDLPGALADLHVRGLRVAGADGDAPLSARQTDLRGPLTLVVGSEGQGIGPPVRRRCDFLVRIPMRGNVGSLNAAVAGSVLLFEVLAQRDPMGATSTPPKPRSAARIDEVASGDEATGAASAEPEVPEARTPTRPAKRTKRAAPAPTPAPTPDDAEEASAETSAEPAAEAPIDGEFKRLDPSVLAPKPRATRKPRATAAAAPSPVDIAPEPESQPTPVSGPPVEAEPATELPPKRSRARATPKAEPAAKAPRTARTPRTAKAATAKQAAGDEPADDDLLPGGPAPGPAEEPVAEPGGGEPRA